MWELDHKESWAPKNRCFWIVVLEKTLKSPLDCKEIKPVNPKGNQPWIFTGRTDAKAEASIIWPPDAKSQLTEKDPDAGKDYRQRRRRKQSWISSWLLLQSSLYWVFLIYLSTLEVVIWEVCCHFRGKGWKLRWEWGKLETDMAWLELVNRCSVQLPRGNEERWYTSLGLALSRADSAQERPDKKLIPGNTWT